MIKRLWRGWTRRADAEAYESLLRTKIVPGIAARAIEGHRSTEILRRLDPETDEIEFLTIMTFERWEDVAEFAGGDGRNSVVPDKARQLLARFDAHSAHYEVRDGL